MFTAKRGTPELAAEAMGRGAAAIGPDKHESNRRIQRDERSDAEKHCQPLACELQRCASRHVYAPQKCNGMRQRYNACLEDFLAASAAAAQKSPSERKPPS